MIVLVGCVKLADPVGRNWGRYRPPFKKTRQVGSHWACVISWLLPASVSLLPCGRDGGATKRPNEWEHLVGRQSNKNKRPKSNTLVLNRWNRKLANSECRPVFNHRFILNDIRLLKFSSLGLINRSASNPLSTHKSNQEWLWLKIERRQIIQRLQLFGVINRRCAWPTSWFDWNKKRRWTPKDKEHQRCQ